MNTVPVPWYLRYLRYQVLLIADLQILPRYGRPAMLYQFVMGDGDGYRAVGAALEAAKAKIFTLLFHLAGLY